jgi:predicted permease
VELGFAAERVLTVELDLTGAGYSTEESMALYGQLYQRMSRVPGVEKASLAFTEPFATTINYNISIPGRDSVSLPASGPPDMNAVTPEFFATMGTRVVAGRGFGAEDRRGAPLVGIVNETMARTLWRGGSALGERICIPGVEGKPCFEVVGIAQDARWDSLLEEPTMQMYFPLEQNPSPIPLRVLLLRASGDPTPVIRTVQNEVRAIAPRVLFTDVALLADNLEPEMRPWRLGATVFTLFGALALVLAGLGLYSVIAYDVAQRAREMAVRMAVGARAADVLRLIISQGVRLATVGIAVGVMIALAAGRWVAPLLFATGPRDPTVLGAVSAVLFGVAVAASLIPAWRATRVPPGTALRAE